MEYTGEQLKERFLKLPEDVQLAISSVPVALTLQAIGEKHRLYLDQLELLNNIAGEVMLGMTTPQDFRNKLGQVLPLSGEEMNLLVRDVDDEIFKPIRASLMKMYPSGPSQEQIDHGNVSAHEILDGIENPWRMSFKVEPIQPILPKEQRVAEKKTPEPEKIAPETLAELPPSLRPSLTHVEPAPIKPATTTPASDAIAPPMRIMPQKPPVPTPPPTASYEIPSAPQQKSVPPPPNLPTKEEYKPTEKIPEIIRTSQTVVDVDAVTPPKKPGIDPYREPIQ